MASVIDIEAANVEDLIERVYEHAYEQGWTDGLPVMPATPAKVRRFVEASGRGGIAPEYVEQPRAEFLRDVNVK